MSEPRLIIQRPRIAAGRINPTVSSSPTAVPPLDMDETFGSLSSSAIFRPPSNCPRPVHTPPYTSGVARKHQITPSPGRPHLDSVRSNKSPSSPMPPPHMISPRTPQPRYSPAVPVPTSSSPYYVSTIASSSISPHQHFGIYPQSYPSSPYHPPSTAQHTYTGSSGQWPTEDETELGVDTDMFFDPDASGASTGTEAFTKAALTSPSGKVPRPVHTPRPPNAWILYRSDKLKAIANGERPPGLDEILAESGLSTSGTDLSEDSSAEDKKMGSISMPPPPSPQKKPKKGAKEPTEGLLSLGRGKTGRGLPQADISKMISMLWKRETPEVRAEYEKLSETRKLQHQEKYPGYKFQPLRKADKIRIREEKEREKNAAKREKELNRSGGRSRRPRPSRTRLSPSWPYALVPNERRPGTDRGRSLSSPGGTAEGLAADTQVSWAGMPSHAYLPKTTGASEPLGLTRNRFRSYPFPIPPDSLPSLASGDHARDDPFVGESRMEKLFEITRHSSPLILPPDRTQSSPLVHHSVQSRPSPQRPRSSPQSQHLNTSGVWRAHASNLESIQRASSPPTEQQREPKPEHAAPFLIWPSDLHVPPAEGFPLGDYPALGPAYAVPYVFEAIPLSPDPAEAQEEAEFSLPEIGDPDSLAAMWCLLEEEGARNQVDESGPIGTTEEPAEWAVDSRDAVEQWGHTGAEENDQIFQNVELSSNVASRLAADWASRQPSQAFYLNSAPTTQLYTPDPDQAFPAGFYNPAFDPSLSQSSFSMDQYNPTLGPFLPLSPMEATFLRPTNLEQRQVRSNSVSSTTDTGASHLPVPRHISASAYPSTPLRVDPDTPSGLAGWGERQASFAAASVAMGAGIQHEAGKEDALWEEGVEVTPISMESRQEGRMIAGPVLRGGTRGRAVGRRFEGPD